MIETIIILTGSFAIFAAIIYTFLFLFGKFILYSSGAQKWISTTIIIDPNSKCNKTLKFNNLVFNLSYYNQNTDELICTINNHIPPIYKSLRIRLIEIKTIEITDDCIRISTKP